VAFLIIIKSGILESIKPLVQHYFETTLIKLVSDRLQLDISYVDVPDENSDTTWIKVARPDIELAGVRSTTIWKLWTLNLVRVN